MRELTRRGLLQGGLAASPLLLAGSFPAVAGPNYLLALDGRRGHIGKLDAARFARETRWTADLLKRLDKIPTAQLAAGDSAVLRPGVAAGTKA